MKKLDPHLDWPLRRIVKRERQGAVTVTVLACHHATHMKPLDPASKFLPCLPCHRIVEQHRRQHRHLTRRKP
jgi:hypothetical protein